MNKDELFDEAMKEIVKKSEDTTTDYLCTDGVLLKPFESGSVFSAELTNRLWGNYTDFNMEMVIVQLEDYGKYKGILMCNGDKRENYIPVSVAKQIVRARGLSGVLGYLREEDVD